MLGTAVVAAIGQRFQVHALGKDRASHEVSVTGRHRSQILIALQVLDVRLHQRGIGLEGVHLRLFLGDDSAHDLFQGIILLGLCCRT